MQTALDSSGLAEDLTQSGPFTVFATRMTNVDAEQLLANTDQLESVLQYHVVSGQGVTTGDMSDGQTLETMSGDQLTVTVGDTATYVNGTLIETQNIEASNGVIHVVERTLLGNQGLSARVELTTQTSTLAEALSASSGSSAASKIAGGGTYTLFAPTNAGFGSIETSTLTENSGLLTPLLNYHLVPDQELRAGDLSDGQTVSTADGTELTVTVDDQGTTRINGAAVLTANLRASDGVMHVIDRALVQNQTIAGRTRLESNVSSLENALETAGLLGTLDGSGPYTVFTPNNGAFGPVDTDTLLNGSASLLESVTEYHVVPDQALEASELSDGQTLTTMDGTDLTVSVDGGAVSINGTPIARADLQASNGVVHRLGTILLGNQTAADRAALTSVTTTLEDLLQTAGLYDDLDQPDETLTVFAPSDGAFASINGNAINALTEDWNTALLRRILRYHVVEGGPYASPELAQGRQLQTMEGSSVQTAAGSGAFQVNGVPATTTDLGTENGVVHRIEDAVLTPSFDAVETTVMQGYTQFQKALAMTNLRGPIRDETEVTVFVPSNEAFRSYLNSTYGVESVDALSSSQEDQMREDLKFHVATEETAAGAIADGDSVRTITTQQSEEEAVLHFGVDGGTITIEEQATIQTTNIQASDGLVHGIDQVLVAPENR
jgi:transforming growth factor-beta-induced protein